MSETPPRLFFALVPEEVARRYMVHQQDTLRRCGWERYARFTPPDALHLTLRFLGPTNEAALQELLVLVREELKGASRFEYEVGKAILFPRVSRAKIVATRITPNFRLKSLARALDRAAVSVGLPAAEFPFRPHITLARIKSSASRPNLPTAGNRMNVPSGKLVLFASDLGSEGSVYRELASFALGG